MLLVDILRELADTKFTYRWRKNVDATKKVEGFLLGRTWDLNFKNNPKCDDKGWCDCILNEKYPVLYKLLQEYAEKEKIPYTSIQVNKNVMCNPHVDGTNEGDNYIITLGNFEGGELVVDGEIIDCHDRLTKFNPYDTHYNLPHTGDRYTLVFYTNMAHKRYENKVNYKFKLDGLDEDEYKKIFKSNIYERSKKITLNKYRWLNLSSNVGEFEHICHRKGAEVMSMNYDEKYFDRNCLRHAITPATFSGENIAGIYETTNANAIHVKSDKFEDFVTSGLRPDAVLLALDFTEIFPETYFDYIEQMESYYDIKKPNVARKRKKYGNGINYCYMTLKPPVVRTKFVIKSKDRVKKFTSHTYSLLKSYNVSDEDLNIFVSDEKDLENYTKAFPDCNIHLGDKGIVGIDNFIVNFFDEGVEYIYMNDDVKGIYQLVGDKLEKLKVKAFHKLVSKMFTELRESNSSYCGLYPVKNSFYMSKQGARTYDLCVIMDGFSAIVNNKNVKLHNFIVPKEDGTEFVGESSDTEKTIQHFVSKGSVVRFNHFAADIEYYKKEGGYQGRTPMTEKLTAEALMKMYPEYVSSVRYKKNGTTSVRLKKLKRT